MLVPRLILLLPGAQTDIAMKAAHLIIDLLVVETSLGQWLSWLYVRNGPVAEGAQTRLHARVFGTFWHRCWLYAQLLHILASELDQRTHLHARTVGKEATMFIEGIVVLFPLGNHTVAPDALDMVRLVQVVEARFGQCLGGYIRILCKK